MTEESFTEKSVTEKSHTEKKAGLYARAIANSIDGVILAVVLLLIIVPWAILIIVPDVRLQLDVMGDGTQYDIKAASQLVFSASLPLIVIMILIPFVYNGYLVGRYGATPGKMMIKARVVNADGSRTGYGVAFLRSLLFGLFYASTSFGGIVYVVAAIVAHYDKSKRTFHDMICRTVVISNK